MDDLRKRFSARAESYDNVIARWVGAREIRPISALVPEGSEVLDFGCGTGRATLAFLSRNCRVTAYDISRDMLAIARSKVFSAGFHDRVEFVESESSLSHRVFPVIACIGVLDYYRDPGPLLTTLKKYLAPEGMMIVTIPNAFSPLAWLYALGSRWTTPAIPRTLASLASHAARAGLVVSEVVPVFPAVQYIALTLAVLLHCTRADAGTQASSFLPSPTGKR
ncbi:MAG: class I SAM-dependent methyltransferase [bacterium JZ-2024 1]